MPFRFSRGYWRQSGQGPEESMRDVQQQRHPVGPPGEGVGLGQAWGETRGQTDRCRGEGGIHLEPQSVCRAEQ